MQLHERIKSARLLKGVTQNYAAKMLDIHINSYSNYERGNRIPDFRLLSKMEEYFGCGKGYLTENDDNDSEVKTKQNPSETENVSNVEKNSHKDGLEELETYFVEIAVKIKRKHSPNTETPKGDRKLDKEPLLDTFRRRLNCEKSKNACRNKSCITCEFFYSRDELNTMIEKAIELLEGVKD